MLIPSCCGTWRQGFDLRDEVGVTWQLSDHDGKSRLLLQPGVPLQQQTSRTSSMSIRPQLDRLNMTVLL